MEQWRCIQDLLPPAIRVRGFLLTPLLMNVKLESCECQFQIIVDLISLGIELEYQIVPAAE